jgi:hypothetical protein
MGFSSLNFFIQVVSSVLCILVVLGEAVAGTGRGG